MKCRIDTRVDLVQCQACTDTMRLRRDIDRFEDEGSKDGQVLWPDRCRLMDSLDLGRLVLV